MMTKIKELLVKWWIKITYNIWKHCMIYTIIFIGISSIYIQAYIESLSVRESSEAGYIITKTTDSNVHFIIDSDTGTATPEFYENFYYTILVDDHYIKIQVPYNIFQQFQLGDHFPISRVYNPVFGYSDYAVNVYDIDVPAVIVDKDYNK